ncbi:MAG: hypothetical protein OEP95_11455, partial [Myxococcales bacterium]|nr:hypothetical protein [Myxococcales bacterium]
MERWIRVGAAVLVAAAVVAAGLVYRDASGLVGATHPGFSVLPSGTVGPRATTPRPEVLDSHDIRPRDRITHADGIPLAGGRAVLEAVRARPSGARITYRVERPRGGALE